MFLALKLGPDFRDSPRADPSFEPVTEETVELKLPSRIEAIGEAAAAVMDAARRLGFAEDALFGIELAVREAITNAVLHGNRQDESVPFEVGVAGTDAGMTINVRDRGEGFDPSGVADPTEGENILKSSGRGILFMRTFMDEVTWESAKGGGTLVRMTKKK
ncbi:MAG: serine/threonine-protein kinase RsbW [Acidobacteriota bacterium]|nr:serine/threonine-protein kinase RsbW [Acidobacteriota bacterium]